MLTGMILLVSIDGGVEVNAEKASAFYVRRFSDRDGDRPSGSVITASVMMEREHKYRLTPNLPHADARQGLIDLCRFLVSGRSGIVTWDYDNGGWSIDPGMV